MFPDESISSHSSDSGSEDYGSESETHSEETRAFMANVCHPAAEDAAPRTQAFMVTLVTHSENAPGEMPSVKVYRVRIPADRCVQLPIGDRISRMQIERVEATGVYVEAIRDTRTGCWFMKKGHEARVGR
jgi:hypothetical protein